MKRFKLLRGYRRGSAHSSSHRSNHPRRRYLLEMLEQRRLLAAQVFAPSPVNTETIPGEMAQFDVVYTALDDGSVQDDAIKTTSVSLRMHYDSSQVTPDIASITSTTFPGATIQDSADTDDLDTDLNTDRFVSFLWFDALGNFPASQNLPLTLFTADFDASSIFTGSIVNFTGSPPVGFDIQSTSATIGLKTFDAADFVVTTIDDGIDFSDLDVTLREAILAANFSPGSQEITFELPVTQLGPTTISLAMGELTIDDPVTISGLGADQLTVNAGFVSRVFNVTAGNFDVALSGMSLTGGLTTGLDEHGGGIRFDSTGTLTLQDVALASNLVQGQDAKGGGVYSDSGTIVAERSDFSGNMATAHGGALATESGNVTLVKSTLRGNSADADGGAVRTVGGTIDVSNSTISGNQAGVFGGGLGIGGAAIVRIANSTIAFNTAVTEGGGLAFAPGANVTLDSTIVAANSLLSGTPNDIQSAEVVNVFSSSNLIGDPNSAGGMTHDANGNMIGQAAIASARELLDITTVLEPLADNGGPTLTHALVALSPAIDTGAQTRDLIVNGGFETGDFTGWSMSTQGSGSVDINDGTVNASGGPFNSIDGQFDAVISQTGSSTNQLFQTFVVPKGVSRAFLSWSDRVITTAANFQDPNQEFRVLIEDGGGNLIQEIFSTNSGDTLAQPGPNLRSFDIAPLLQSFEGQTIRINFVEQDDQGFLSLWIDSVSLSVAANEDLIGGSDQRGTPLLRDDGGGVDIGAYERQTFAPSSFIVTTETDELDFSNMDVSLREAISRANASAGADEITFDLTPFSTIRLSMGELEISSPLTITGLALGQDLLTIDANQQSRVLDISSGNFDVTFRDIGLTGGRTTGINEDGGGIRSFSNGTLTLIATKISGNSTEGDNASGGGVYASGGDLIITGSMISGNSTSGDSAYGGGVESNNGDLTITFSSITGNSTSGGNSVGGGIDAFGDGSVSIAYTTISGNIAANGGGLYSGSRNLTITGTTLSGNTAGNDGGGILALGDATILNSTISGNTASQHGGGIRFGTSSSGNILSSTITANDAPFGGGVYGYTDIASLTIDNSIVAGNSSSGSTPDLSASATVRSSLIGELQGTNLVEAQTPDADGNLIGAITGDGRINPMLGPIANHGKQTETHALLIGSRAIDAGSNALLLLDVDDLDGDADTDEPIPFDQRGSGFPRLVDGDENGTAIVDMGAFEFMRLNQQPTFIASDPAAVLEDSGPQSTAFATFDPGDPSESSQSVLAYTVTNISNPALFSTPPEIGTDGNLAFTLVAHAFGTSSFDVTVQDDGGTEGGGVDTSQVQTFQITVTGINDAPSFVIGDEVTVNEDSGARTITGFASEFDPGPNESGFSAASQVIHDEGADGTTDPFSTDNNNPTDVGKLAHGSNIVRGYIESAKSVGDVDVFTFTIDPGFQLDGLFVLEFDYITPPPANERAAFLAINDAATFPYNAQELDINNNPDLDESLFLGGTVFGLDDLPGVGGGNILPRAGVITGRGFTPPLGAGTYTIYIQQTGPANTYALDFQVTATSKQSVAAYTISNLSDTSLFASQPQIDSNGNLTFRPADNVSGTATFDVVVQDDGGADNGGVDTSAIMLATITINGVNDPPTFTASDPVAVLENSGPQTVPGFAAGFDPGPSDEADQTVVAYKVSNISESALFADLPAIDSAGQLTYTPAADAFGISTFDVTVQDSGGTDNGGNDTSSVQTFTITVNQEPSEDFGDAPSDYPVLLSDDGARHTVAALFLGAAVDIEADGQPTAAADGDGDDDDGVFVIADMIAASGSSTRSSFTLISSGAGLLDAWIDFSGDSEWDDAGEQIATSFAVSAGSNTLSYTVPAGAVAGDTAARFRLSTAGGLAPTGAADDGEVEDYIVTILDGGLAPDAKVDLIGGDSTIGISDGQLVVQVNPVLFSAPVDSIGLLDVQGIAADELVSLDYSGGGVIPPGGLHLDGGGGSNTLAVVGGDSTLDLTSPTFTAENFSLIDLGDDNVNVIRIDVTVVRSLAPITNSVRVVGGEVAAGMHDAIMLADADDWRMGGTSIVDGRFIRSVIRSPVAGGDETLQTELPHAWQNIVKAGDVNNNGDVTANDALVIINELARRSFSDADNGFLDDPLTIPEWPGFYYDQNGNDKATALDALRVINELARLSLGVEEELQTVDRAMHELFSDAEPSEVTMDGLESVGTSVRGIASFETSAATSSSQSAISVTSGSDDRDDLPDERAVDELLSRMTRL